MAKDTSNPNEEADHSAAAIHSLKTVVDKSLNAFSDLNAQSKSNIAAVVASNAAFTQGVKALQAQFLAFGKQTLAGNIAAAKALSGARSLEDVVELQTNWAKSSVSSYVAELSQASETITGALKASFEPLNERIVATVETLQGAR